MPRPLQADQPWDRQAQRQAMTEADLDVLIIGGGASGAGVLLDAQSRGLKAALIERQDFMAGTSSRSTKLIHGGVRYLEQAFKTLDIGKYQLVREALAERKRMLAMAPHLAWPLTLITPVKSWIGLPYYRTGLGLYDLLAGSQRLGRSRIESKNELKRACPAIDETPLKGGVSYQDGQFDDARFGIAMVRTALEQGGLALNYCAVDSLIMDDNRVTGARCRDQLSGDEFELRARAVVNCTGPWTDQLRQIANPNAKPMMTVSSGIHLLIDRELLPDGRGILIPETEDGRVLFLLPWLGKTLVGTTDDPAELSDQPEASQQEIDYLLRHLNGLLSDTISESDISATFSGLRPLVSDPHAAGTSGLSRDHVIVTEQGLTSLTGGKWTTWRRMAEDCMDVVVKENGLKAGPCRTQSLQLAGANGDRAATEQALKELPADIADHLWQAYGDRAAAVLAQGSAQRLLDDAPYVDAELSWALDYEGACRAEDVLNRRLRIGMLNQRQAEAIGKQLAARLAN
ncbi:FAD-dependent oxidoreductase [Saccharospirillum sp. HFRX-1]|uniref:glycerol-3-phosphate dehydrogenase/oxidase n=1 Tax=unclassified Saccharospirillum TaxID=2633430 RepID=UPI003722B9B1